VEHQELAVQVVVQEHQVHQEYQAQVVLVELLVLTELLVQVVSKVIERDYNINFQLQPVVEILEVVY
jgi:hypothetical protein